MGDGPPLGASVFTTLRWLDGKVAWLPLHLVRLRAHAERVGIDWPETMLERLSDLSVEGEGNLCRIRLQRDGEIIVKVRSVDFGDSPLCAVSAVAPRFPKRVQGTKHANWHPYREARAAALDAGADLALLVHDGAVVDGDRCTPILLDTDGVAWAPAAEEGGVDSITLALLAPAIEAAGIPFRRGRLTENLIGRARELVVVSTGLGVCYVDEIDGQAVGTDSPGPLFDAALTAFNALIVDAWTTLGGEA